MKFSFLRLGKFFSHSKNNDTIACITATPLMETQNKQKVTENESDVNNTGPITESKKGKTKCNLKRRGVTRYFQA